MTIEELKGKIDSIGNIKVIFEPNIYSENLIPKKELQNILEKSKVNLRGWSFPHIPTETNDNNKRPYFISDGGIEFYDCWSGIMEIFRFYQSGQFLAKMALREDTMGKLRNVELKAGEYLDFLGVIYKVTEVSIFIKNIIENTEIEGGTIIIEINNTKGRKLDSIFNNMIDSFYDDYISGMNPVTVSCKFDREKIVNNPLQISRELIGDIFTEFNWTNYSEQMIQTHQENLVNRKI